MPVDPMINSLQNSSVMVGLDPIMRSHNEMVGAGPDGRIKSDHDAFDLEIEEFFSR